MPNYIWFDPWWSRLNGWNIPAADAPVSVVIPSNPPYGGGGTYGSFEFQSLVASANGTISIPVSRAGGIVGIVGVDVVAVDGTAVRNVDYFVAATTTLAWVNNEGIPKSVSVTINPSVTAKTFSLRLQNPTGGATVDGTYDEITITIPATAGAGGTLRFYYGGVESGDIVGYAQVAGAFQLGVYRLGSFAGAVGCSYHTVDGTAVDGIDYTAASGTVAWADGDSAAKLTGDITVLGIPPGNKYFYVVLDTPTGGAYVPTGEGYRYKMYLWSAAVVPGSLQFNTSMVYAPESAAYTFTVQRVGGSTGAVSVNYSCAPGTAANGSEYTAASGTLNWIDGDATDKTFNVTMLAVSNSSLYFTVNLSAPGGGASLGSIPTVRVYVLNSVGGVPNIITDTIEDTAFGLAIETIAGQFAYKKGQEAHIVVGQALVGAVIGFSGGTDSFGGGTDLMSDDDNLLGSSPLRFIMSEM